MKLSTVQLCTVYTLVSRKEPGDITLQSAINTQTNKQNKHQQ